MCGEETTIVISFLYVFSGFEPIGLFYNTRNKFNHCNCQIFRGFKYNIITVNNISQVQTWSIIILGCLFDIDHSFCFVGNTLFKCFCIGQFVHITFMYLIIFHYYINNQSILLEIEWSLSDCRIWNICFITAVLYYVNSHRQVFDQHAIYCANSYRHVLNSVQQTVTDMCSTVYSKQLQTCVQQRTENSYRHVLNSVDQTVTDMCLTAYSKQLQTCA
jgi:hypothetical protein